MSEFVCPSRQELEAFDDGRLADPKLDGVAEHIAFCERCQDDLRRLGELKGQVPLRPERFTSEPECVRAIDLVSDIPRTLDGQIPSKVGKYDILEYISSGGMGTVYKAFDPYLERVCAIKLIRPSRLLDDACLELFLRESKTLARLNHSSIVTAFDGGRHEGGSYLVMEHVDGRTLEATVSKQDSLPVGEVLRIARQLLDVLDCVHQAGLVHRDVKPSNVITTPDQKLKLLDFGISTKLESKDLGFAAGTLDYMAPEQACDQGPTDRRADYYSFGATLHYLLASRPPFDVTVVNDSAGRRIERRAAPSLTSTRADVPAPLSALVAALLNERPEDRPQSARHIEAALNEATRVITRSRFQYPLTLVVTSCIVVLVGLYLSFPARELIPNLNANHEFQRLQELVSWSEPDERTPLPGLLENPARLPSRWQIATVDPLRGFMVVSPDPSGQRFACLGADGLVRVFGLGGTALSLERLLPVSNTSESDLLSLEWTRDGRRLAVTGSSPTVSIWDVVSSRQLTRFNTSTGSLATHTAWSPDERRLAVGCYDGSLMVFASDGRLEKEFTLHRGDLRRLAWLGDATVVTAGQDGMVIITELDTGKSRVRLTASAPLWSLGVNPADGMIAAGSESGTIYLLPSNDESYRELICDGLVSSIAWDHGGHQLAAGAKNLYVWPSIDEQPLIVKSEVRRREHVTSLGWLRDDIAVLAAFSGSLYHLIPKTGDVRVLHQATNLRVMSVAWNPSGDRIAASVLDGSIRQFDSTGKSLMTLRPPQAVDHGFSDISWSPNGKMLASGDDHGGSSVRVWDAEKGAQLLALPHGDAVLGVGWNAKYRVLATGDASGALRLWETEHFQKLESIVKDSSPILCVRWNTQGNRLAVGKENNRVLIYEWVSGGPLRLLREWPTEQEPVRSLSWSPDGTRLAVAGSLKRLYLLDVDAGAVLWTNPGDAYHRPGLLDWNAKTNVLSCGACGIINVRTGAIIRGIDGNYATAVNADGLLAEGTWNGTIRLQTLNRGTLDWTAVLRTTNSASFAPTGRILNPDPQVLDEFVYFVELEEGRTRMLSPMEFFKFVHE